MLPDSTCLKLIKLPTYFLKTLTSFRANLWNKDGASEKSSCYGLIMSNCKNWSFDDFIQL